MKTALDNGRDGMEVMQFNDRVIADLNSVLDKRGHNAYQKEFNTTRMHDEGQFSDVQKHMLAYLKERSIKPLSHGPLHGIFSSFNFTNNLFLSKQLLLINTKIRLNQEEIYEPFQAPFDHLEDLCEDKIMEFINDYR